MRRDKEFIVKCLQEEIAELDNEIIELDRANDVNDVNDSEDEYFGDDFEASSPSSPKKILDIDENAILSDAKGMSTSEIKAFLKEPGVDNIMKKHGLCLDDLLKERQRKRFGDVELTTKMEELVEKRRIEALFLVLLQKKRHDENPEFEDAIEHRKKGLRSKPRLCKQELTEEKAKEIFDQVLDQRQQRFQRQMNIVHRTVTEERELAKQRLQRKEILDATLREREERVLEGKRQKKKELSEKRKQKLEANARAKLEAEALEEKRIEAIKNRVKQVEARSERLKFLNSGSDTQALLTSTDKAAKIRGSMLVNKHKHRRLVLREAARKKELREQEQEERQRRRLEMEATMRRRFEEKQKLEQEKREMVEIDRVIKLERLKRQEMYRVQIMEQRALEKINYGKKRDELTKTLKKGNAEVDRLEFNVRSGQREKNKQKAIILEPGPGSYDIGMTSSSSHKGYTISLSDPKQLANKHLEQQKFSPGPGEYANIDPNISSVKPGVSFGKGEVPSQIDLVIRNARETPAPNSYKITHGSIGKGGPAFSLAAIDKSRLKQVRSEILHQNRMSPGPGHYY